MSVFNQELFKKGVECSMLMCKKSSGQWQGAEINPTLAVVVAIFWTDVTVLFHDTQDVLFFLFVSLLVIVKFEINLLDSISQFGEIGFI